MHHRDSTIYSRLKLLIEDTDEVFFYQFPDLSFPYFCIHVIFCSSFAFSLFCLFLHEISLFAQSLTIHEAELELVVTPSPIPPTPIAIITAITRLKLRL